MTDPRTCRDCGVVTSDIFETGSADDWPGAALCRDCIKAILDTLDLVAAMVGGWDKLRHRLAVQERVAALHDCPAEGCGWHA